MAINKNEEMSVNNKSDKQRVAAEDTAANNPGELLASVVERGRILRKNTDNPSADMFGVASKYYEADNGDIVSCEPEQLQDILYAIGRREKTDAKTLYIQAGPSEHSLPEIGGVDKIVIVVVVTPAPDMPRYDKLANPIASAGLRQFSQIQPEIMVLVKPVDVFCETKVMSNIQLLNPGTVVIAEMTHPVFYFRYNSSMLELIENLVYSGFNLIGPDIEPALKEEYDFHRKLEGSSGSEREKLIQARYYRSSVNSAETGDIKQ